MQVIFQLIHDVDQNGTSTNNARIDTADLHIEEQRIDDIATRFDLEMRMEQRPSGLGGILTYSTDLFTSESMRLFVEHFVSLLQSIGSAPSSLLSQLTMMTGADRLTAIGGHCVQGIAPTHATLADLFEQQADRHPDAIAIVEGNTVHTYATVDRQANSVALHLATLEVQPDDIVGLCVPRGAALLIGMLGILKSGAAYLPLDASQPADVVVSSSTMPSRALSSPTATPWGPSQSTITPSTSTI